MTMRVTIQRLYTETEGTDTFSDRETWEIATDAPYNPDVVDDLSRRVVEMRAADRASNPESEPEEAKVESGD